MSLITLGVADLARARTFYETGLGWKALPASQGDVVFFPVGALAIALFPRPSLAEDAGVAAEAAGARINKPAADAFWAGAPATRRSRRPPLGDRLEPAFLDRGERRLQAAEG